MPPTTDAVLTRVPVAVADTRALTVYVTEPLTGRLTCSEILPAPLVRPVAPPEKTAVQVIDCSPDGKVSNTETLSSASGPAALATTIVYVTAIPRVTDVTPSVLVTEKSAVRKIRPI